MECQMRERPGLASVPQWETCSGVMSKAPGQASNPCRTLAWLVRPQRALSGWSKPSIAVAHWKQERGHGPGLDFFLG